MSTGKCQNCRAHESMVEAAQRFHGESAKIVHHARTFDRTLGEWFDSLHEQTDRWINHANMVMPCTCKDPERVGQ